VKKSLQIKVSTVLFLSTMLAVYFNGVTLNNSPTSTQDAPVLNPGGDPVSLEASDYVSLHHSSGYLVNSSLQDAVTETMRSLIETDPRFTQTQFVKNNAELFDTDWPAVPRCSLSVRGRSRARAKMTISYDLNAREESVQVSMDSAVKNRMNLDLNFPGGEVFFRIDFEKYRCGELKWTRSVVATARGVRIKSDADFDFSGSDFRFLRLRNEDILNLDWPEIASDSFIIDTLTEIADSGSIVEALCTATDCLNEYVLPFVKSSFNWNEMLRPIVNGSLAGIKEKIANTQNITASGIGLNTDVSLKNVILGGGESISVLFDARSTLNFNSHSCADGANLVQSSTDFGALANSLKTGLGAKFSTQLVEAMAFAVVKKGHLCKTLPISLAGFGAVNLITEPEGDVFISKGNYKYDQETKSQNYRDLGVSPWITATTKDAGSDSGLYLNVPVALRSSNANVTSTVKGLLKVYFNLDTSVTSTGGNTGVQFSIKEIVLQDLSGSLSALGKSENASTLRPKINAQLSKYKEKRVTESVEKKCHADRVSNPRELTEEDYILTYSDQSIYYRDIKNYIENCSGCSYNLNLDLKFLDAASSGQHLAKYKIDAESNLAFLFGATPYGSSTSSTDRECPNLEMSPQERERLEDAIEEGEERLDTGIPDRI
jgi:hypothetical protein